MSKYIKSNNKAYKQVSIDIDILSEINRISKENNMSFSDVLNFLLMEALGMNTVTDDTAHFDESNMTHNEE